MRTNELRFILVAFVASAFEGCVTHITPPVDRNPPPTDPFSHFATIEITPVNLAPPYAGQAANQRALLKIQENVSLKIAPALAQWNSTKKDSPTGPTLLIEPTVTEIKFINGNARFWAGALAGSSAVVLRAKITEKETGRIVATPEFYARAAAMGGAFTFGVTDNIMLTRIAGRLTDYLIGNYEHAVGGGTGVNPAGG